MPSTSRLILSSKPAKASGGIQMANFTLVRLDLASACFWVTLTNRGKPLNSSGEVIAEAMSICLLTFESGFSLGSM